MAPQQIFKNFRFKLISPLLSPAFQDEASLSIPLEPLPFFSCVVVSSNDDKGKTIVVDSAGKIIDGKKRKLFEYARKFQDIW
jgi:hypothetical protein